LVLKELSRQTDKVFVGFFYKHLWRCRKKRFVFDDHYVLRPRIISGISLRIILRMILIPGGGREKADDATAG
jgi:hypothetical protein